MLCTTLHDRLEVPYSWTLRQLQKFLYRMEDTEAPLKPLVLLARNGTRTILLDKVAVPEVNPPLSPVTAHTLVNTADRIDLPS